MVTGKILKNYQFKVLLKDKQKYLENFKEIIASATAQLLERIWSEKWIKRLGKTTSKAHSIITAEKVTLIQDGHIRYIPSRVRMGIAEQIGRILRSQYKRMSCFYDCLKIIEIVGIEASENKLSNIMTQTYKTKNNIPIYKKVLIQQTIQLIKNWAQRLAIDFQMVSYCQLVKPTINKFVFLYAPDNYRILKYEIKNGTIFFEMKLPTTINSAKKTDWMFVTGKIRIPSKLQAKISTSKEQHPKKPQLLTKKLKGGREQFFLQFPWEFEREIDPNLKNSRALAVDQGVKKLATFVVCEKKKQISKPYYLKLSANEYHRIEALYKHLKGISKQLWKNPNSPRLKEERDRLYRKLARIKNEMVHSTTNYLIEIAKSWQCKRIILEDLRRCNPPRNRGKWSRRLNDWLRGRITTILEFKGRQIGIRIQKVTPWGTSSYCARCAEKGQTIKAPNNPETMKSGRWFHCPSCGFTADRDYNAAVNVYRASFIDYRKRKSLKDTSPIPYMEMGTPSPNCSWRGVRDDLTQIVLVTGG